MAYRNNLLKLMAQWGIPADAIDDLPEDRLLIEKVTFYKEGRKLWVQSAMPQNREHRFFLQHCFTCMGKHRDRSPVLESSFRRAAEEHYAERWQIEVGKQFFIDLLRIADSAEIEYRLRGSE